MKKTMNLQEMLTYDEGNGSLILNTAFANRIPRGIGEVEAYSGICGSYNDGIHQWATHNILSISESENAKYKGWTVAIDNGSEEIEYQMYIPKYILNVDIKNDWKFAKNLFNKHLRMVPKPKYEKS